MKYLIHYLKRETPDLNMCNVRLNPAASRKKISVNISQVAENFHFQPAPDAPLSPA